MHGRVAGHAGPNVECESGTQTQPNATDELECRFLTLANSLVRFRGWALGGSPTNGGPLYEFPKASAMHYGIEHDDRRRQSSEP